MEQGWLVLWPDERIVTGEQLIRWAQDDVADGKVKWEGPVDLESAVMILQETGSVTLGGTAWK